MVALKPLWGINERNVTIEGKEETFIERTFLRKGKVGGHAMETDKRPSPKQILARLRAQEERAEKKERGQLKIFLGYAAGTASFPNGGLPGYSGEGVRSGWRVNPSSPGTSGG
jgi:hypothetical protein